MKVDEKVVENVCAFAHATASFLTADKTAFDKFCEYVYQHRNGSDWLTLTETERIAEREAQISGLAQALHASEGIRHVVQFDQPAPSISFMPMPPIYESD
jgi:hypothetical protein